MKSFLALALVLTSINTFAFEKKATLDLTQVYGNHNAGLYEVTAAFTKKTTPSESSLTTKKVYDDGYFYCTTTAQFDVGQMDVTLVNKKTGWVKNVTKKIVASISRKSQDDNCITDLEGFSGEQLTISSLGLDQIVLPVAAPVNYDSVVVYLAPYAASFKLNANVEIAGDKLSVNPAELLNEKNVMQSNANNAVMTYFLVAKNGHAGLSLANGSTSLK